MGEVWRARDTVLGREVAVKVLKQEYADDPTFRAPLRRRGPARRRRCTTRASPSVFDYGDASRATARPTS